MHFKNFDMIRNLNFNSLGVCFTWIPKAVPKYTMFLVTHAPCLLVDAAIDIHCCGVHFIFADGFAKLVMHTLLQTVFSMEHKKENLIKNKHWSDKQREWGINIAPWEISDAVSGLQRLTESCCTLYVNTVNMLKQIGLCTHLPTDKPTKQRLMQNLETISSQWIFLMNF